MKTIKIITLCCFLSIGISQNKQKHSVFVKAQLYPSVGINYRITTGTHFRTSLLLAGSEIFGNTALLFDIFENEKLKYYLGPSYTASFSDTIEFVSIGQIIGIKLHWRNKLELFGEIGIDLGNNEGNQGLYLLVNTGIGLSYYFGK